jgi:hypothetical protein
MPLAVVVSAGLASTSTRSARGFTLTDMMKLFNRLIDFFELRKRGCHLLCQGPAWKILSYKAKKMSVYCDTLTFSNMNAL